MTFFSRFRDPVSGLTHLAGALLGLGLLALLVTRPPLQAEGASLSLAIFGLSLVLLYSASAAYHLLKVSDKARLTLRRLDHSMVSVFIAGTYTPFCVITLKGTLGTAVLAVIWTLTIVAVLKSFLWLHSPRWVTVGLYILMGWVVVVAVYPLYQALSPSGFWLLLGGGLFYSFGALIYAVKWPDPWPPAFGFHEIWHVFVLAGSACHAVAVLGLT